MARKRSVADLRRMLKRRLASAELHEIERTAVDLRNFAIASRFFDGFSVGYIEESVDLTRAVNRLGIEDAIRSHSVRRR